MRVSNVVAGATLGLASCSQAINILLNNDDGFGSGNLREVYRLLKKQGHNGELSCRNPSQEQAESSCKQYGLSRRQPSRAARAAARPLQSSETSRRRLNTT
jgi:broad specificity polyphosphatase/5'/3'-nucleotidase SurE